MNIDKAIRFNKYHVYIVGVGGTGARVARDFFGFAYSLKKTESKDVIITLCDDDVVEPNNILRQPFCPDDVGRFKSEVLAERYSAAYDMDIHYRTRRIEDVDDLYSDLAKYNGYVPILVGCVDNIAARKIFHKVFKKFKSPFIWIDSGNSQTSGQAIMGIRGNKGMTIFPCLTDLFPEILKQKDQENRVSCSNAPITNLKTMSQFLVTNMTAATVVVNFLTIIMFEMDINTHAVVFEISNISVHPDLINYEELIKSKVS